MVMDVDAREGGLMLHGGIVRYRADRRNTKNMQIQSTASMLSIEIFHCEHGKARP